MRINTLTFDANLPTTQQVNVPTNTDYKVGMKVKRNGEIQQLGPDEFTIYTGEINVIPPTQYTSDSKTCENGTDMNLLTLMEANLSAMAGQSIKYTDVYVEFSFDDGTTWSKQTPTYNSVVVRMIDRAGGTNNVIAGLDLRYQNKKWILQDHGVATGEVADYVAIPEAARIQIMFLGSDWGSLTYPCLWRLVFLYGGEEIPITIPTDADKTNGYVTFTQASNDDANFRQLSVVVEHGYTMKFYDHNEIVNTSGSTHTVTALSADMSDYAGITVKPSDVLLYGSGKNSTTPPTEAEMEENLADYWHIPETFAPLNAKPLVVDSNGVAKIYMFADGPTKEQYCANLGWPSDKPAFFCVASDNNLYMQETYTFEDGDILVLGKDFSLKNNRNVAVMCKITAGTPFKSNFKLNVNEFKSQCGDLNAQTDPEFNTAKVEGTYADGTEFSYDFCIQ